MHSAHLLRRWQTELVTVMFGETVGVLGHDSEDRLVHCIRI